MSGIVLSASVRQNLLSLQSTADLLATTQNRLSTGKSVNSALDNPTNFFTAQSLDNRASDINNLLDSIGNGVQVLQAANTGLTSLQKLIDSAKSIANQALQTTVGYSSKSSVSTTISGATAADLRGTTSFSSAVANSNVLYSGAAGGVTAATSGATLGGIAGTDTGTVINASTTAAKLLNGAAAGDANAGVAAGDTLTVNGKTVTFAAGDQPTTVPTGLTQVAASVGVTTGNVYTDASGNVTVYLGSTTKASIGDVLTAVDLASGVQSNVAGTLTPNAGQSVSTVNGSGALVLKSTTGSDLSITGKADILKALGLTSATGAGNVTASAARTTSSTTLSSLPSSGSTLNVDGHVITFKDAPTPAAASLAATQGVSGNVVTDGNGNSTVYLQAGSVADVLKAIDFATGVQTFTLNGSGSGTLATAAGQTASSINTSGQLKISTGVNADLSITGTGNALQVFGLAGNTGTASAFTAARTSGNGGIAGKTLTFTAFNGGTAVNVTFGDGTNGTVKTLDQLNTQLQANNLAATIDANGQLTITASNDYASSTIGSTVAGGAIGGTLTSSLTFTTASTPIQDVVAQSARANLVSQYNNILNQIDTTSVRLLVQWRELVERRPTQAGVRRDWQVEPEHHWRDLQLQGSGPGVADRRHRLHRQRCDQQGADQPELGVEHAAFGSFGSRFEPLGGADPSGLQQEPDQRAADRLVESDPGRHQRRSGQQPGAVDPPVDRGLCAVAGQHVAAERAPAAPLIRY